MKLAHLTSHRLFVAFWGALFIASSIQSSSAVSYIAQQSDFTLTTQDNNSNGHNFSGDYNSDSTHLGIYANGGDGSFSNNPQAVAYHKFTTDGTLNGTAISLGVGQSFSVTLSLSGSRGINGNSIGFALNNGSTFSSVTNYNTNNRFEYSFTAGDSSAALYDANGKQQSGLPGFSTFAGGLTYTFTLVSTNEYNFSVSGGGATYNIGTLGGTANSLIQSFALFNRGYNNNDAIFSGLTVADVGVSLTANTGETKTVAGQITDNAADSTVNNVTKLGVGTVILTNSNSYTGTTSISAGTLNLQNSSGLGSSSSVSVTSGAALELQGGISVGARPITINGAGPTDGALRSVSGNNSYAGAISLGSASTINSNTASNTLTLTGGITDGGFRVTFDGAGNTTLSTVGMSGTGGDILKQGSGTLNLNVSSTYTGSTGGTTNLFIDQGTVQAGASGAVGTTNGTSTGYIALGSSSLANLTSSFLISAGGVTVANPIDARYFNNIGGTGGLTGAETLGGSNTSGTATYSGSITLHNNLGIVAATGGTVNFTGPMAQGAGGSPYSGEAVNGTPAVTIGDNSGNNNGTVTFSGTSSNTYAGTTTVNSGTVNLSKNDGLGLSGSNSAAMAFGGSLVVGGGTVVWNQNNEMASSKTITINSGTVNLNGFNQTVMDLTNTGGTFTTGAGKLTGTGASMTWGASSVANTINTGGTVEDPHTTISGGTNTIQKGGLLQIDAGTGLVMSGGSVTVNSDATAPGKILLFGANTNDINTTATSSILSDSLTNPGVIDFSSSSRTINVGSGATLNVTTGIINGTTLNKSGTGTLKLGNNSVTGTVNINAGTLQVDANGTTTAGKLASSTTINVNSGGTLLLSGTNASSDRINNSAPITLNGGTFARSGTFNEGTGAHTTNGGGNSTGTNTVGMGALTLSANSTLDFGTGGGVGTLVFASFTPNTHVLNILNWTSSASAPNISGTDGTDDRLIFNQDESANLADFTFGGGGISATEIALGGGFFEIVPVPEPGTWAAGGLATALLIVQIVRARSFSKRTGRS